MNLIKIGGTILNVDRINGIQEFLPPADPSGTGTVQERITRVLFDHGQIDLTGADAKSFRRWYRHLARDIAPHKDEDGEELVSQENQLRETFDVLLSLIDRVRPRDPALRNAAHHVSGMIDRYMTGELEPMRLSQFARTIAAHQPEAVSQPDSALS
jgi:hypothetical protein